MTADAAGGVWNYTLELAAALLPLNVELAVAVMGPPPSAEQRREALALDNVELYEKPFALEWMNDPWRDVALAGDWLLELEEAFRPDIVHLNNYCHGSLPWEAPVMVVAHSCVLSWWLAVKGEPAPRLWTRYRTEVAAGLRGADLVVAPTRAMLSTLLDNYSHLARTHVIFNGRDAKLFPVMEKRDFVLAAGRLWDEGKNLSALEPIAAQLPWPIFVAGPASSPDGKSTEFTHVDWLGPMAQPDLANWMGLASIYALPARYEPFGLGPLEAALAGCALVLGDIPSLREVWEDTALFVSPDDPEALDHALRTLIANPDQRKALASASRRRALEFTPAKMAQSYFSAYQQMMARQPHAIGARLFE